MTQKSTAGLETGPPPFLAIWRSGVGKPLTAMQPSTEKHAAAADRAVANLAAMVRNGWRSFALGFWF